MGLKTKPWSGILTIVLTLMAVSAHATTLIRADLDTLVDGNSTVVIGEVLDRHSYWNEDGTFILTDVRISANAVLKGALEDKELTLTLMGGQVGDLTTLIVGGAELELGGSYLLFLNRENLPGAPTVRTVRDHCQGVFDLVLDSKGLRATSQAKHHTLMPDVDGLTEVAGGAEGFELESMMSTIRELTALSRQPQEEQ